MTLELIDKRIEILEIDKEKAIATVNAIDGAIQDCLYWKQELEKNISEKVN